MERASIMPLVAALAVSSVLAGCGSDRNRNARIAGLVEVCGDPFPRATPAEEHHCTLQAGSASILGPTHRVVAHMRLVDGRFAFTVLPGRYTLIAWNSGNGPWKRTVSAVADHTTHVNVAIEAI